MATIWPQIDYEYNLSDTLSCKCFIIQRPGPPSVSLQTPKQQSQVQQCLEEYFWEVHMLTALQICRNLLNIPPHTETSADDKVTDAERWPVAWLLLQRHLKDTNVFKNTASNSKDLGLDAEEATETKTPKNAEESSSKGDLLVIPLRIDLALPDYAIGVKEFKDSAKLTWKAGQRFQMFFAGKKNSRGKPGDHESSMNLMNLNESLSLWAHQQFSEQSLTFRFAPLLKIYRIESPLIRPFCWNSYGLCNQQNCFTRRQTPV